MKSHSRENLFRYLHGDLSTSQGARVESHLKACSRCRDFIAFVRGFNVTLKEMAAKLQPDTPHPEPEILVALQTKELDEKTARSVRQHVAFCKDCLSELSLLQQVGMTPPVKSNTSVAGMTQAQWRKLVGKLKATVVELGRKYGPDTLVGPCRILSEIPRQLEPLGQKYLKRPAIASKAIKVGVGKNAYGIRMQTSTIADRVDVHVDTLRQSVKRPLDISVHSNAGEELVTTRTDTKDGFSLFSISGRSIPDDLFVLTLRLKNSKRHLLIRVPLKKLSAVSKLDYTERAIIRLMAQGNSIEEVMKKRSLDRRRVNAHLKNIFKTLGVSDLSAVARYGADLDAVKLRD